jgi:hypothetical protein
MPPTASARLTGKLNQGAGVGTSDAVQTKKCPHVDRLGAYLGGLDARERRSGDVGSRADLLQGQACLLAELAQLAGEAPATHRRSGHDDTLPASRTISNAPGRLFPKCNVANLEMEPDTVLSER